MADAAGAWLELADLRLAWSPRALLRGRLVVEEVSAARAPAAAPAAVRPRGGDRTTRRSGCPSCRTACRRSSSSGSRVERIELGPEVLGEAASFTLAGRLAAADDGQSATLALSAERLDRPTAQRQRRGPARARSGGARRSRSAPAETGGLLAALSRQPQAGDFSLRAQGRRAARRLVGRSRRRRPRAWRAPMPGSTSRSPSTPTLQLDATVRPAAGVLPADARAADRRAARRGADRSPDRRAARRGERPRARDRRGDAHRRGRGRLRQRAVAAPAQRCEVPDLAPLGRRDRDAARAARCRPISSAAGALLQPKGRLRAGARAAGARAGRRRARRDHARVRRPRAARRAASRSRSRRDGRAQSLRLPPEVPLPPQDVTWQLEASGARRRPGHAARADASPRSMLALQASGELDAGTLAGDGQDRAAGRRRWRRLTEPFGQRLAGELALDADLQIARAAPRQITVDLTGGAAGARRPAARRGRAARRRAAARGRGDASVRAQGSRSAAWRSTAPPPASPARSR